MVTGSFDWYASISNTVDYKNLREKISLYAIADSLEVVTMMQSMNFLSFSDLEFSVQHC